MLRLVLRDAAPADAAAVVGLNEEEVRWTSPMDPDRLGELAALASCYRVAVAGGTIAGFVLGMREGCGYRNPNFEWFQARYRTFLYIDRVVVARRFAGRGVGRRLYADALAAARRHGAENVVCEYSWEPRNQASERFHARLGFEEVGRLALPGAGKVVSLQRLRLGPPGPACNRGSLGSCTPPPPRG